MLRLLGATSTAAAEIEYYYSYFQRYLFKDFDFFRNDSKKSDCYFFSRNSNGILASFGSIAYNKRFFGFVKNKIPKAWTKRPYGRKCHFVYLLKPIYASFFKPLNAIPANCGSVAEWWWCSEWQSVRKQS